MICFRCEFNKKYVENLNNLFCLLNLYFLLGIILLYMSIIYIIKFKFGKLSFFFKGDKLYLEYFRNKNLIIFCKFIVMLNVF